MVGRIFKIILGGVLALTILTGCTKSESETLYEFDDTIRVFQMDNLTEIYERKGDYVIDSYCSYTKDDTTYTTGIVLFFRSNIKQAKGAFIIREYKGDKWTKEEKYNIAYNENKIELTEEIDDEDILEKFNDFKLMFEFCDIDYDYLKELKLVSKSYDPTGPLYSIKYSLPEKDKNIKKIKVVYPQFMDNKETEATISMRGDSDYNQRLQLDINNKYKLNFRCSCSKSNLGDGDEYFK